MVPLFVVQREDSGIGCFRLSLAPTGVGRVFHGHELVLSVVIDIINVLRVALKAENHPPVGAYCNFERVQPEPRHVQMGNGRGQREASPELFRSLPTCSGLTPPGSSCSKSRFNPLWLIVRIIHTVTRHVAHVRNNFSMEQNQNVTVTPMAAMRSR